MDVFTGMFLIDVLAVLTALLAVGYAYFKWSYQYWKRRNVPYLEPTIPFGSFQGSFRRTVNLGEEIKCLFQKAKDNGWKHCGTYLFLTPVYIPVDLDLTRNILSTEFQHFGNRGMYTNDRDDPLGSHLITIGGERWRNLRTKFTPSFSSGKLKIMFQTLVNCGLVLERYLEESVDNRTAVDIKHIMGRFSTDVIGSCAFGIDCNCFKESNSPFRVYANKALNNSKLQDLIIYFADSYHKVARALKIRRTHKDVSDFFMKVVEDIAAYRERNNIVRNDFLQLLLDIKSKKEAQENGYKGTKVISNSNSGVKGDGKTLTMAEIASQTYVFFVAGFETSSSTMALALYQLATHPEIQDKVREEIKTVLARHDNQITYDSVCELKYMGQVIDETLRLCPPVPLILRQCEEAYKVPDEEVIIERGTKIFISILSIHHDKRYYKNPEIFDPERFSDENKKLRHPYAYIPFGKGPRICIAQRFGLMQSKVGLTCILRNYKVSLNEKTKVPLKFNFKRVTSYVEGGIWLNLEKL